MNLNLLRGSFSALVTPFQNGKICFQSMEKFVDWQISEGSHGLVPVGTTGESPTLSFEEHCDVIVSVINTAENRVPVIAGTGSNCTRTAINLTQRAQTAGASAALVVCPYYNNPSEEGLFEHFRSIHKETDIPIILYNIPGRCVVDIKPTLMGRLAELTRIVGVKDATASMERVSAQRAQCGQGFLQFSSEDTSALGFIAHGGVGCISVTANVTPRLCAKMQDFCRRGDFESARLLLDKLMPLHEAIFLEPGSVGAKFALSLLGKCSPEARAPHAELADATKTGIMNAMKGLDLID